VHRALPGVTPAAISLLLVHFEKKRNAEQQPGKRGNNPGWRSRRE